ncbi:unnamed protein product, partial [Porites evermanni]
LKKIRSLVQGGAMEYENFVSLLKLQEGAFKLSIKDLRSSVTREACVTLSYLSTLLKNQFDHTAEAILPALINLIPNSAKIMATSGHACIRFILKVSLQTPVSLWICFLYRRCCDYIDLFLVHWDASTIKPRISEIEEALRKGISDADAEARSATRRAFWHYHELFRDKAESLLKSFDVSKQKQLENDRNLSNLGPTKTSTSGRFVSVKPTKTTTGNRVRSSSAASEDGTVSSRHTAPSRQTVGASSRAARTSHREDSRHAVASKASGSLLSPMVALGRSISNIDHRSAERASARSKLRSAASRVSPQNHHAQLRQPRTQHPSRGTVSQPGSRSQSPDRLLATFPPRERSEVYCRRESLSGRTKIPTPSVSRHPSDENLAMIPGCRSPLPPPSSSPSFLPVRKHLRMRTASQSSSRASSRASSRGASRDTSPDRRDRRLSVERGYSPSHLPVLKKASPLHNPPLKQSSQGEPAGKGVTEAAVWDAWHKSPSRRKYSFGSTNSQCSDDDNDSDVGSISSERSYGSRGSRTHHKTLEPGNVSLLRYTRNMWHKLRL